MSQAKETWLAWCAFAADNDETKGKLRKSIIAIGGE
jgi:hypothetical protein